MGRAHIEDVFYGGENGGPIEIIVPKSLRKHISADRCRFVLHVFAFHTNDENRTFPSISKVAQAVDFDQRKVRVAIKVLECNGLLVRVANYKVGKKGIVYYFNLPSFCEYSRPTNSQIIEMLWDPERAVWNDSDSLPAPTSGTQSVTPACDKEEHEDKSEQEKELPPELFFEENPFELFWQYYPRKTSLKEKAREEWVYVTSVVPLYVILEELNKLLKEGPGELGGYLSAHVWLSSLLHKS